MNQSAPFFRSSNLVSEWLLRLLAFSCIAGLSIKYKEIGAEGVRPLHSVALILISTLALCCLINRLPRRFHFQPVSLLLYACAAYVFCRNLTGGERGIKDGLYILSTSIAVFWATAALAQALGSRRFIQEASGLAAAAIMAFGVPTMLAWVDPRLELGLFDPSPSFLARAHGSFGDPTSFGTFCALALLIILTQFRIGEWPRSLFISLSYRLAVAVGALCIAASGSRMALLSLILGALVFAIYDSLRWRAVLTSALVGIAVYSALLSIKATALASTLGAPADHLMLNLLNGSVRLADVAQDARLSLSLRGILLFNDLPSVQKLTGCGYHCIEKANRSSHVGYLDLLVNYGLILIFLFFWLLLEAFNRSLVLARNTEALPLALLAFFLSTVTFLSWPFNAFFNYPFFAAQLSFTLIVLCAQSHAGFLFPESAVAHRASQRDQNDTSGADPSP